MCMGIGHAAFSFCLAGLCCCRDDDGGIRISFSDLAEERDNGTRLPHRDGMDPNHLLSFFGRKGGKRNTEALFPALFVFAAENFGQRKKSKEKEAEVVKEAKHRRRH